MDTGVEAFGKVGIGHMVAHLSVSDAAAAQSVGTSGATHSATGLLWGGGMQYYFMPEFAVVGQWVRVQGSNSTGNESMLSGGVSLIIS
jgi:opacity protein-like surface antigen